MQFSDLILTISYLMIKKITRYNCRSANQKLQDSLTVTSSKFQAAHTLVVVHGC